MKTPATDRAQITAAIAKFDPAVARKIRAVRTVLRKRFPTAFELAYDNYNFFVLGYCSTERPSDCVVSIAADVNGVGLSFYRGADVSDPRGLLVGSGKQNRFLRLPDGAKTLAQPGVAELLDIAEAQAPTPMRDRGALVSIIRSISLKQRPRR